jgi:porin
MKWYPLSLSIFLLLLPANSALAEFAASASTEKFPVVAVTPEQQRSEVQPTEWSFQAVRSLIDRYGCITTYPNDFTASIDHVLTRYEFATGLNNCLTRMNELSASSSTVSIRPEDLNILRRLQQEFATELARIRERTNTIADSANKLDTPQFSPTTKLRGQAIVAVNGGGFSGERIIDAQG